MIIDKTNIDKFINGPVMDCSIMEITEIKFIPEHITILWCDNNQLTYLPLLPNGLIELYCYGNQLTYLPLLPNSLKYLSCSNNKLINYPTKPLSNWIKQHNRKLTLNKLLNDNK